MTRASVLLLALFAFPPAAGGEEIFASWSPYGGGPPIYMTRFDSETPWLYENPFPGFPEIPPVALDFDPVTRQLWGFDYFECNITCPQPPDPVTIDPLTGEWSSVELPGLHLGLLQGQDADIDPVRRELRYFGGSGQNFAYSLDLRQLRTDTPLNPQFYVWAVAHRPPTGGAGAETYVLGGISGQNPGGPWFGLARVGGAGGVPPASSGLVEPIGPIDLEFERLWFDISAEGTGYVAAANSFWPKGEWHKLFRIDLESGALEEIGVLVEPGGASSLAGIAVAPPALGAGIVEIPSLSRVGLALLAVALGLSACALQARRRRSAE